MKIFVAFYWTSEHPSVTDSSGVHGPPVKNVYTFMFYFVEIVVVFEYLDIILIDSDLLFLNVFILLKPYTQYVLIIIILFAGR